MATTFIVAFVVWTGLIVLGMASGEARARAVTMQPEAAPFVRAPAEPGRSLERLPESEGGDYSFVLNTRISGPAGPQQASDAPATASEVSAAEDTSAADTDGAVSADTGTSSASSADDAADSATAPAPSLPATGLGPER